MNLSAISRLLNVLSGPDDTSRRKLLNILLLGTVILDAIMVLIITAIEATLPGGVGEPGALMLYLMSLALSISIAIIFAINRYGPNWLASLLFLSILMVLSVLIDKPREVANGRSLINFAIPIIMASVLLRPSASFVMAFLSSLVITVVALGVGLVPNPFAMAVFFIIALVSWLSAHTLGRALHEARSRAERLAAVNRIAKAASTTLHLDELIETVYREVVPIFQADTFFIALHEEETSELDFRILMDEGIQEPPGCPLLKSEQAPIVNTEKKHLVIQDSKQEQDHLSPRQFFEAMKPAGSWLEAPIRIGEREIGAINVQAYRSHAWNEEDELLLLTIADQVAVAIENAQLFEQAQEEIAERKRVEEEVRRRNEELSTMLEASKVISSTLDLEEVLARIAEQMVKAVGVDGCTLSRWDQEADAVVTWIEWRRQDLEWADEPGITYDLDDFPATRVVLETRQPHAIRVSDPSADPGEVAQMRKAESASLLILPLAIGDRVFGLVELDQSEYERDFTAAEIRLCQALADQAAVAIENARLFERAQEEIAERKRAEEEARRREAQAALIYEVSQRVSSELELDELFSAIVTAIFEAFGYYSVALGLLDEEGGYLALQAIAGGYAGILPEDLRSPIGVGMTGRAAATGETQVSGDVSQDPNYIRMAGEKAKSELVVPIKNGKKVIGVLDLQSEELDAFDQIDVMLMETLADQVAVVIENARLFEQAQKEIAERKRAEDSLRTLNLELDQRVVERTQELAEALSKNQAILEGIADGVIVFDQDSKATVANPAISYLLERIPNEVIGCDIGSLMGEDVDAADQEVVRNLLRDKGKSYPAIKLQWGERKLSVSFAPVRDNAGRVTGTVAVFRDFTREAEVDRMKSAFISTASHELRTPLNAIVGYADMLQEGVYGPLSEKQCSILERVVANTGHLVSLINNLLDQAQIEAGTLTLDLAPFAPADLVDNVIGAMGVLAHTKGLELTSHLADDLPATLLGDQQRLRQILFNLVNNAIKFTDKGAVRVRIYQPDADHWALAVSDTGRGIPPKAQSYIFEPFRQVDEPPTRDYTGAGLGLSIVKQLTEIMGGDIVLESEVGRGSTFTVILPLVPLGLSTAEGNKGPVPTQEAPP